MKTNIQEKLRANKEAWIDMLHILRRELYTIFTDKGVLIVFFVACLVYPMVCGYIYNHEVMTDMPVAVVDKSNTALSREYIRRVDATPEVRIARSCESLQEAQNLQRHSQVHGIIYIPEDFSTSINTKRQTTVSIYADVTSFFWYRNLALASSSVSLTMGGEIQAKNRIAAGEMYDQAVSQVQPFKPTQHVLYNPGGYPSFILPIVLILVLQQTLLIGIGMMTGKATETNKLHIMIPENTHYRGLLRIIFGRALALFITYIPIVVYMLIIVPKFFNIPQLADSSFEILWFITPFLFAVILMGMTIGTFFKNKEDAIPFYIFLSVPMLLLTGLSWPREAMPAVWQAVSHLFPSTDAANAFARLNSMGSSMAEISSEHLWLWILAGFYFLTTYFAYQLKLKKAR